MTAAETLAKRRRKLIARGAMRLVRPTLAEKAAPPFRTLKTRWPVDNLEEAFAEGVVAGHIMPEFQFEPQQIHDLIAFLNGVKTGIE